jgi:hypothetical protein
MPRLPITFRSAAFGLLLAVIGGGALLVLGASAATAGLSPRLDAPPRLSRLHEGNKPLPRLCPRASLPLAAALRQDRSTPGGAELSPSRFGALLASAGSLASGPLFPAGRLGARPLSLSPPSLRILFCTWLT